MRSTMQKPGDTNMLTITKNYVQILENRTIWLQKIHFISPFSKVCTKTTMINKLKKKKQKNILVTKIKKFSQPIAEIFSNIF